MESAGRVRDAFGSFSVLRDNYSEVRVRLEFAWAQVAAAQVSHRVDFRGLDNPGHRPLILINILKTILILIFFNIFPLISETSKPTKTCISRSPKINIKRGDTDSQNQYENTLAGQASSAHFPCEVSILAVACFPFCQ